MAVPCQYCRLRSAQNRTKRVQCCGVCAKRLDAGEQLEPKPRRANSKAAFHETRDAAAYHMRSVAWNQTAVIPRANGEPHKSWWTSPQMQTSREIFSSHLQQREADRMTRSRFGNVTGNPTSPSAK